MSQQPDDTEAARAASLNRLTFVADYLRPMVEAARLRFATATLEGDEEAADAARGEWQALQSALHAVHLPLLAARIERMRRTVSEFAAVGRDEAVGRK